LKKFIQLLIPADYCAKKLMIVQRRSKKEKRKK
jgi:hypothetical protein